MAIIHTIDFFTPVVDDPYQFGAIAAANAMSDVYAMGGEVILALNVCGFPEKLPKKMILEILRGGAEKVAEAGGILAGGHTIDCKEPIYGLSVLGKIHPEKVLTRDGARVGDVLVLTKPLGVGIITTALKGDKAKPVHIKKAAENMIDLNKISSRLIRKTDVSACTDISGFSFLGHSYEIAQKSGVRIQVSLSKIPFHDGVFDYAKEWLFPGGTCKNEEFYKKFVDFDPGITDEKRMLLFTPETSGGLLAAVSEVDLEKLTSLFDKNKYPLWLVGEVKEGKGVEVIL